MCTLKLNVRVGSLRNALRDPRCTHRGRKSGSCGAAASARIVRGCCGGPGLGSAFRHRWVLVVCAVFSFFTPHTALLPLDSHQPLSASPLSPPHHRPLRRTPPPPTSTKWVTAGRLHPPQTAAPHTTPPAHTASLAVSAASSRAGASSSSGSASFSVSSSLRGSCSPQTGGSRVGSAAGSSSRGETMRSAGTESSRAVDQTGPGERVVAYVVWVTCRRPRQGGDLYVLVM